MFQEEEAWPPLISTSRKMTSEAHGPQNESGFIYKNESDT